MALALLLLADGQSHINWPARITATVLMIVTVVLLFWRRRQRAERKRR